MAAEQKTGTSEPTILDKIYAQRVKDVEAAKITPGSTWDDLQAALPLAPPLISFPDRLRTGSALSGGPALMAEIKRASPSKGDIDLKAVASLQARTYALAGASVISVLTEPTWFKGSILDMRLARAAIDSLPNRPAVLRKEFIFDQYQILEARVHGADTVLLIVAMLETDLLADLYAYSQSLGMEPLVEVNNADEMAIALDIGARVIGVNNRDLRTFNVDMGTTSRLADLVTKAESNAILCALSGIKTSEDVQGYVKDGVGAVLVGESLMRAPDVRSFVRELLSLPEEQATPSGGHKHRVKLDGVTPANVNDPRVREADFVGVFISSRNPKAISLSDAAQVSTALRADADVPVGTPPVFGEDWFAGHTRRMGAAGRPLVVGVLDDDLQLTLDDIVKAVLTARLDAVQLASSTPLEWARHIPAYVIRSMFAQSVLAGSVLTGLKKFGYHHAVLIRGRAGGFVVELQELAAEGVPLIVLEEATTEDVRNEIRPWAVCSQL